MLRSLSALPLLCLSLTAVAASPPISDQLAKRIDADVQNILQRTDTPGATILIQVYFNSGLAYWLNRRLGVPYCVAGPSALIGASNFFELAVATAVGLFGVRSGAALATVVGVLIEVPVMLSVVRVVNRSREWYEARA